MSVYFIFYSKNKIFNGQWLPYFGGALSGLLTGLLGSGGAIRSLALTVFNLNPIAFIATSTLIDFGGDMIRLYIYIQKGYLNEEHYFYLPILMAIAVVANWTGKRWISQFSQEYFKRVVLYLVLLMGLASLVTAILST